MLQMAADRDRQRCSGVTAANAKANATSPTQTTSLKDSIRAYLYQPQNWIAPILAAGVGIGLWSFYQNYLRRFPGSEHIAPSFFRRRSLLGKVTSVGDGDGFHLFHTPGGRLAGWGWLRHVPTDRKVLKGRTISVRLAGIDAPEGAYFGRPAQPYAAEALAYLESLILNRRVRAYIYRRDQYDRVVATVYVRTPPFFFPRKDVSLEMLKRGLATTYEGKFGAEFGGAKLERLYKETEAEARRQGKGMWSIEKPRLSKGFFNNALGRKNGPARGVVETPMEYKKRMRAEEKKGNAR